MAPRSRRRRNIHLGTTPVEKTQTVADGVLSSRRIGSMEMLVARDEISARFSAENSFLTDPHTLARYDPGTWRTSLFQRDGIKIWQLVGFPGRLREKTLNLRESG